MLGGYAGKILFVDLTTRELKEESPPESLYRDFIGGTGLGIRILYEHMKPKADPLGPENILGFTTGVLTATPTPGSGRFMVTAKSPLTGTWCDSNCGGSLGPELKRAGYDAVFFSGVSSNPVYLMIDNGNAELRDASHLWGRDSTETENILQQELGKPEWKCAYIGPAGESCNLIASVMHDKDRAAARSGVGAVMGSKKLKAIAVRGNMKIPIAKPDDLKKWREIFNKNLKKTKFNKGLADAGTGGGVSFLVGNGDTPIKNWTLFGAEAMPTCTKLDSGNMDPYKLRGYGCHTCPIRCSAVVQVKEGPFKTISEVGRPEYETLAALGTMCFNDNLEVVMRANEVCNRYGMDTMNCGGVLAFAMECYEKGVITKEDTDGIELTWGNGKAMVAMLEKMGRREGFGAVLADGIQKAAERIGKGCGEFAIHVHGQTMPYHDPRVNPCQAVSYISEPNPARHMESQGTIALEHHFALVDDPAMVMPKLEYFGDYDSKGPMYAIGAQHYQFYSSAGLCSLFLIGPTRVPVAECVAAVTGWDFDWPEALRVGKRIQTLRQAFTAREGLTPDDFIMPKRLTGSQPIGESAGAVADWHALRSGYYQAMGFDFQSGKPYPAALYELGLGELTRDLRE